MDTKCQYVKKKWPIKIEEKKYEFELIKNYTDLNETDVLKLLELVIIIPDIAHIIKEYLYLTKNIEGYIVLYNNKNTIIEFDNNKYYCDCYNDYCNFYMVLYGACYSYNVCYYDFINNMYNKFTKISIRNKERLNDITNILYLILQTLGKIDINSNTKKIEK